MRTARAGKTLVERLAIYPGASRSCRGTSDPSVANHQFVANVIRRFLAQASKNLFQTFEIYSERLASFDLPDCKGHACWFEPREWLRSSLAKQYPLHLISSQPKGRLHSQYDQGKVSRALKVKGREAMRINPFDAQARGIGSGDLVRVFNDRGACLAGAVLSEDVSRGIVQLPVGAWYDPQEPGTVGSLCKHGNPNVLTRDEGSSCLGQGPSAMSCLVDIQKWDGAAPVVTAFNGPRIV